MGYHKSHQVELLAETPKPATWLWVDAMIDPMDTRKWISMGIAAADHNPEMPRFNVGGNPGLGGPVKG